MSQELIIVDQSADESLPWEPMSEETSSAFEAFATYRDLPGTQRSLSRVARDLDLPYATVSTFAKRFDWANRARAWDLELDRAKREKQRDELVKMTERHVAMSMSFQQKLMAGLAKINIETLRPGDLIRWFSVAVEIEKNARGLKSALTGNMPQEQIVFLRGDQQINQTVNVFMTPELEERIKALTERAEALGINPELVETVKTQVAQAALAAPQEEEGEPGAAS
jgi:hypothetical protein